MISSVNRSKLLAYTEFGLAGSNSNALPKHSRNAEITFVRFSAERRKVEFAKYQKETMSISPSSTKMVKILTQFAAAQSAVYAVDFWNISNDSRASSAGVDIDSLFAYKRADDEMAYNINSEQGGWSPSGRDSSSSDAIR